MLKPSIGLFLMLLTSPLVAIEIPLDTLTPVRIGFVDLQKVFDTYPEKSFAEGDLLREIEKRRRELGKRQAEINALRGQVEADEEALQKARAGQSVIVPVNAIPEPESVPAARLEAVATSTSTPVEPYPLEDPLAGLPGHETNTPPGGTGNLPGIQSSPTKRYAILDSLATSGDAKTLSPEAIAALELRIGDHKRALERSMVSFKLFRGNAVADMKQLQAEKTYGVMARIYAILQQLARDESVMVVLDKTYVLYGEDGIDLSDKLIARLQAVTPL